MLCYYAAHSCTGLALGYEQLPQTGRQQASSVPDGEGDLHTPTGEQASSVPEGGGDLHSPTEEPPTREVDDAEYYGASF